MTVWWNALDTDWTSYLEVKHRKVLAQGWKALGDLRTIRQLACDPDNEALFKEVIRALASKVYGADSREITRAPNPMWTLLQVRKGDLVVGIEGQTVRGICKPNEDAIETYRYECNGMFEYAQTVCAPVEWHDWHTAIMGQPPRAPARSVLGIKSLNNERTRVIDAWSRLCAAR